MMIFLFGLVLMMGTMFLLGSEFGQGRMNRRHRRETINNRRNELKNSGLQSVPYDHVEKLDATFSKDLYGDREFKFAALIVTSPSGRRFVVDTDLRSNDGTIMKLTSFATNAVESINSYLSNIGVIDVISNSIEYETVYNIENYYAFQKTIDDIRRGKHWLAKEDTASIEIRFFDFTYGELRSIAEQDNYIFYLEPSYNSTKTEKLFHNVEKTLAIAEASLARCDMMVNAGRTIIRDIIDDTVTSIKTMANTQNNLVLAYADTLASGEEFISDEEWKDIKIFTPKTKTKKTKKGSSNITLEAVESMVNNAKLLNKRAPYEIAMDSDNSNADFYRHNRKQKTDKKSKKRNKKRNKKQRNDFDN